MVNTCGACGRPGAKRSFPGNSLPYKQKIIAQDMVNNCGACGRSGAKRSFPGNSLPYKQNMWVARLNLLPEESDRLLGDFREKLRMNRRVYWCDNHFDGRHPDPIDRRVSANSASATDSFQLNTTTSAKGDRAAKKKLRSPQAPKLDELEPKPDSAIKDEQVDVKLEDIDCDPSTNGDNELRQAGMRPAPIKEEIPEYASTSQTASSTIATVKLDTGRNQSWGPTHSSAINPCRNSLVCPICPAKDMAVNTFVAHLATVHHTTPVKAKLAFKCVCGFVEANSKVADRHQLSCRQSYLSVINNWKQSMH